MQPTVSVIIPTFNRSATVRAAVESVLGQTFQSYEIIVVDDGSTDATVALIESMGDRRVRCLRHPVNRGAAAARNTGIADARGRYIAFLDSDDTWLPTKLERQIAYLDDAKRKLRAVCCGFEHVLPGNNRVVRIAEPLLQHTQLFLGCRCAPGSTLVAEASLFREVGMFDEALRRLEDWDWLLRCSRRSPIGVLQEPLAVIHVHPSRRGLYPAVVQAVTRMEQIWLEAADSKSRQERRALAGTLRNEIAAIAYGEGYLFRAAWHLLISFVHLPRRGSEFFWRIGYRIYCDVGHVVRRLAPAGWLRRRRAGHLERSVGDPMPRSTSRID